MIPFKQAWQISKNSFRPVKTETAPLKESMNRVLAKDVISDIDMPPFNKSAMDGYACRKAEIGNELTVIETISAGGAPKQSITENTCAKIMTGAMVPDGADVVIKVEDTESAGPGRIRYAEDAVKKSNTCIKAEYIRSGDVILPKGTLIRPQEMAALSSVGSVNCTVAKFPRIGIIATGNVLVPPERKAGIPQIRNSNNNQLYGQALRMGITATDYGIAKDTEKELARTIGTALNEHDIVILSGGVSMGIFDLVPQVLKNIGISILFDRVAVKPGKRTTFGTAEHAVVFALAGNPVSAFFMFEVLIKPYINLTMGYHFSPVDTAIQLEEDIKIKRPDRYTIIPVTVTPERTVKRIEYHGSARISSLCRASGIICIPAGILKLNKGTVVYVRQI